MPDVKEPTEVLPPKPKRRNGPGRPFKKGQPVSGRPFQPGVSGNPGGRPVEIAEVREAAKQRAMRAIEVLEAALEAPDWKVRVTAANAILDRAVGRPAVAVEVGITPESALARLAEALVEEEEPDT